MKNLASLALRSASTNAFNAQPLEEAANLNTYAFTYLFRGSVVLTAALSNYALEQVGFAAPWLPWMVLMPLMGMVQGIRGRRQRQLGQADATAASNAMRLLQKSFVLIILLSVACACVVGWAVVHPLLLVLYGVTTYIAGRVLHFRPLQLGGVVCGVLGAAAATVPADTQLLLIAAAMLLSYIIPGYLLRRVA
ncbi:hypothetical protein [Hymenobacter sp.]|jgi:hypothetical protein|uniref:hypothetical protein n=1 Tax=Hymenobacter sp. TaxID=1898978 RepID=UPI002ED9B9D8